MTATDLGLDGPVRFLGAYVKGVSCNLGLTQGPSTCSVTLAEDLNQTPMVTFVPPELGSFVELNVGDNFKFTGVITKYEVDVENVGGRFIKVNISDVREIMKNCPLILAPGYRTVADHIRANTECSVIDVYGAFDTEDLGFNISSWNQSGMEYINIKRALEGGAVVVGDFAKVEIPAQGFKSFGEKYRINLSEVTPLVNPFHRVNTNLISLADFIQELATLNQFDWFIETVGNSGEDIEVIIRTISRKEDNIGIDLAGFLADNKDKVLTASSGLELRNEIACSVLLGAPLEQMRTLNILGMANTPVDLSSFGGYNEYYMTELEMRVAMGTKASWEYYAVITNRDYGTPIKFEPIPEIDSVKYAQDAPSARSNKRRNERAEIILERNAVIAAANKPLRENNETKVGKIYEILKSHAESSYGKRFLFQQVIDVDYIDAAWTVDAIAANPNPSDGGGSTVNANEFFRNDQGKTRCYVEFRPRSEFPGTVVTVNQSNLGLGIGGGFAVGRPGDAKTLELGLSKEEGFHPTDAEPTSGKENYMYANTSAPGSVGAGKSLFVAASIEDNNTVIKLDGAVFKLAQTSNLLANLTELTKQATVIEEEGMADLQAAEEAARVRSFNNADGVIISDKDYRTQSLALIYGAHSAWSVVHRPAYQPYKVHIPTRSKFIRYGPVFSSSIHSDSVGKLVIDQDDGFSPWEFGSSTLMIDAMQFKVNNQSSNVKDVESANITIENYPQFSIGEFLGKNSNISSINISFGGQVTTTYQLQSFLRKFGELTKDELATLSLFARRGGRRVLPQDMVAFIDKYRTKINAQFSGRGSRSTSDGGGGGMSYE